MSVSRFRAAGTRHESAWPQNRRPLDQAFSTLGWLCQTVSARLSGNAQRMYQRFGDPIDIAKPQRIAAENWVASVRKSRSNRSRRY